MIIKLYDKWDLKYFLGEEKNIQYIESNIDFNIIKKMILIFNNSKIIYKGFCFDKYSSEIEELTALKIIEPNADINKKIKPININLYNDFFIELQKFRNSKIIFNFYDLLFRMIKTLHYNKQLQFKTYNTDKIIYCSNYIIDNYNDFSYSSFMTYYKNLTIFDDLVSNLKYPSIDECLQKLNEIQNFNLSKNEIIISRKGNNNVN